MREHAFIFVLFVGVVAGAEWLGCTKFNSDEWTRIMLAAIGAVPALAGAKALDKITKKKESQA